MSVSRALKNSARAFCIKYSCNFDFDSFESRVEEYTFLRPNNGWLDLYKMTFGGMYKKALEVATVSKNSDLDAEAMLDDFEYTLIRPFVSESKIEIRHKPYIGMDRMMRLEYLDALTGQAPKNPVELYSEKYQRGALTIRKMKSGQGFKGVGRENYIEAAGYVQALENVNKSRSAIWRAFHTLKNREEKKEAAFMKKVLVEAVGGEETYEEMAKAALETFDGYKRVSENLAVSTLHAKEEVSRMQKLNAAMREPLNVEGFDEEKTRETSLLAERSQSLAVKKQNLI